MAEAQITNPMGAHYGLNAGGAFYYQNIVPWRANGSIAPYDTVSFVAATASNPVSVKKTAAADAALLFCGVAQESAIAGDQILVCMSGFTLVNIGTTSPAAGNAALVAGASDGVVGVDTATDATDIVGAYVGVFLGPEVGATNQAPIWVFPRA